MNNIHIVSSYQKGHEYNTIRGAKSVNQCVRSRSRSIRSVSMIDQLSRGAPSVSREAKVQVFPPLDTARVNYARILTFNRVLVTNCYITATIIERIIWRRKCHARDSHDKCLSL